MVAGYCGKHSCLCLAFREERGERGEREVREEREEREEE
jgi:hypothetical protein